MKYLLCTPTSKFTVRSRPITHSMFILPLDERNNFASFWERRSKKQRWRHATTQHTKTHFDGENWFGYKLKPLTREDLLIELL